MKSMLIIVASVLLVQGGFCSPKDLVITVHSDFIAPLPAVPKVNLPPQQCATPVDTSHNKTCGSTVGADDLSSANTSWGQLQLGHYPTATGTPAHRLSSATPPPDPSEVNEAAYPPAPVWLWMPLVMSLMCHVLLKLVSPHKIRRINTPVTLKTAVGLPLLLVVVWMLLCSATVVRAEDAREVKALDGPLLLGLLVFLYFVFITCCCVCRVLRMLVFQAVAMIVYSAVVLVLVYCYFSV